MSFDFHVEVVIGPGESDYAATAAKPNQAVTARRVNVDTRRLFHLPTSDSSRRLAPSGHPLPDPPEDQGQKHNRHPLPYDYGREGTIDAHSLSWSWRSRRLDPSPPTRKTSSEQRSI